MYKFAAKGAVSLNIKKIRYQVKKFSILSMGRCKPLGSLEIIPFIGTSAYLRPILFPWIFWITVLGSPFTFGGQKLLTLVTFLVY